MFKKVNKYFLGLLLALLTRATVGQDVDLSQIGSQKPIRVSGSVSALNRFYTAFGIEDRQDPYIWTLSGRLNFSVFGIAVPLSGTITSQNTSFTQPYNRLSLKPSYKWAKAHIGYSNMTYSAYTLAGHTFLGGGLELNPGKIRFAASYGRFATAIPLDRAVNQPFVPSFDRFGYGGKIGYGDDSNFIDFSFFTAEDQQDSWDLIPDSTTVFPGANMVLGTTWKLSLIKNLSFSGEVARSAYTNDVRDEMVEEDKIFSVLGFDSQSSTIFRNAMKFSVGYSIFGQNISGTYERIDPEYQTMGAYFFNNDIENITGAYSTSLFKNKIAIAVNGGLQRNNLFGDKESESVRTIGSGNLIFVQNPFSIGVNYSNFSNDVRFVLNESLDSLNAVVVTQSAAVFGSYTLGSSSDDKKVLSFNVSRQAVNDDFTSEVRSSDNVVFTGTLNYTMKMSSIGTDLSARLNYNRNDLAGVITSRIGPGVTAKRKFFQDKLTSQTSVNYFSSEGNQTLTVLVNGSVTIRSMHTLAMNLSFIQRSITTAATETDSGTESFGETIATINYSFNF